MTTKIWNFILDNKRHTVRLEHGYFSGKREVYHNSDLIHRSRRIVDTGDEICFEIGYDTCCVIIEPYIFKFNYACTINGLCTETGQPRHKERSW